MIVSEEIKRLHELHQAGALSDVEFAQAKARLLNNEPSGFVSAPAHDSGFPEINRFRRSRDDRWLGGVCGGLGQLTGLESWIWRLIVALVSLTFGVGLVIYILLWIFVPDEELIGK